LHRDFNQFNTLDRFHARESTVIKFYYGPSSRVPCWNTIHDHPRTFFQGLSSDFRSLQVHRWTDDALLDDGKERLHEYPLLSGDRATFADIEPNRCATLPELFPDPPSDSPRSHFRFAPFAFLLDGGGKIKREDEKRV